jgi:L,D-transpeptidase-like protein
VRTAARRSGAAPWRRRAGIAWVAALGLLSLAGRSTSALGAQTTVQQSSDRGGGPDSTGRRRFASAADSADWDRARALADNARGFRLVISILDRRLWAIIETDTLLDAPVGVASGLSLDYQGRRWTFTTPRGRRTVITKDSFPDWVPPDWHYYEVARERGLVVRRLVEGRSVELEDGRRLDVRSGAVGVVGTDSVFTPLPAEDEIIYDGFLFIPPLGSVNRRIAGELGTYRIDLGGGYLLHGTPHLESIGAAATHGCIRLRDADIAWLYAFARVGLPVYIY